MLKKILLVSLFICSLLNAQQIYDLIQPVNLLQDGKTTVLVSDLFYSENYDVKFSSSKNIDVTYDASKNEVSFTPKNNFSGIVWYLIEI